MNIKKTFLLMGIFTVILNSISLAQGFYTFSNFKDTYISLDKKGPVKYAAGEVFTWSGASHSAKLGFTFNYFRGKGDSLGIDSYSCGLQPENVKTTNPGTIFNVLTSGAYAFRDRAYDTSELNPASHIWYRTEGTPGNRIFQIEYYNVKTSSSKKNDSINFQVWLYEKDNSFEYRFGAIGIETPDSLFYKGFMTGSEISYTVVYDVTPKGRFKVDQYYISGDPENPTFLFDTTTSHLPISKFPSIGTVYRFDPKPLGINENHLEKNTVFAYPNPFQNSLMINDWKPSYNKFEIYNQLGQMMKVGILEDKEINNLNNLTNGIYFLKIYSNKNVKTQIIIKE